MLKHLLKIICFAFLPLFGYAQNAIPETYHFTTDTVEAIKLDRKFWRIWDDSLGNTDFKIVSSPAFANRFRQFDTTKPSDFSIKTYWYKVKFKNITDRPLEIGIPAGTMYNDLYYADSTLRWQHFKIGWGDAISNRSGYKRLFIGTIILQPFQEIIVYSRQNSTYRFGISDKLTVFTMQAYLQKSLNIKNKLTYTSDFENIVNAILLGIIILAFFINFTFYRATKEKEYVYFSLFLLFFGLNIFVLNFWVIVFNSNNTISLIIYSLTTVGWIFLLMLFVRYFFKTQQFLPKWDRLLKYANYFIAFDMILSELTNHIPLKQNLYDRVNDFSIGLVYLFFDFIFVTIFLVLLNKKIKNINRILATIPIFFLLGPVTSWVYYYQMVDKYYAIIIPAFVQWIWNWQSLLILIGISWMILFFSWLLFKRYQSIQEDLTKSIIDKERLEKEKEAEKNLLISQQNERLEKEVAARTRELQNSLDSLKAAQSQLIQSEKMASLGELTAGIAHEIQNPLNFVNNFSEVNKELVDELQQELKVGNTDNAIALSNDIKENEEKINHHGKRADAIVKGMLQHSRSNTGAKEPTDINKLADEYLRLAYHGLRVKDKSFNATMKTHFDTSIEKVNIIPQDIGRVILNLLTNAFYIVHEKKKTASADYEPTVNLTTKRSEEAIKISVTDNGNGIPKNILDKIFQPFFTTKPTGQGTGLGLSLSYDIVKSHGGDITVETKDGEGSIFTIKLPI